MTIRHPSSNSRSNHTPRQNQHVIEQGGQNVAHAAPRRLSIQGSSSKSSALPILRVSTRRRPRPLNVAVIGAAESGADPRRSRFRRNRGRLGSHGQELRCDARRAISSLQHGEMRSTDRHRASRAPSRSPTTTRWSSHRRSRSGSTFPAASSPTVMAPAVPSLKSCSVDTAPTNRVDAATSWRCSRSCSTPSPSSDAKY